MFQQADNLYKWQNVEEPPYNIKAKGMNQHHPFFAIDGYL
jgi:hypothetical protein